MLANYDSNEPRLTVTEIPIKTIAVQITQGEKVERFVPSNGTLVLGNYTIEEGSVIEAIGETVIDRVL